MALGQPHKFSVCKWEGGLYVFLLGTDLRISGVKALRLFYCHP